MPQDNLYTYKGKDYKESALRDAYPEKFDVLVEKGILTLSQPKQEESKPIESEYIYQNKAYKETALREAYPDKFDALVERGVLKKKDKPSVTESPSTAVQGQSSLGSQAPQPDASFLSNPDSLMNDAVQKYVSSAINDGVVTEEQAYSLPFKDIVKAAAEKPFASNQPEGELTWDTPTEPQINWGNQFFEQGADTTDKRFTEESVKKTALEEENKKVTDIFKENVLNSIPEEERTPENLKKVETDLNEKGYLVDLTGDKVYGDRNLFITDAAIGATKGLTDIYLSSTELIRKATGDDFAFIPMGGVVQIPVSSQLRKSYLDDVSKKMTQIEGDILDNLSSGNLINIGNLTAQQLGESAPMMVISAATGGGASSYAAISLLSGSQYHLNNENEDWYKELSGWEKLGTSAFMGGFESLGEVTGARVAKRVFSDLAKDIGGEGGKQSIKEFLIGYGKAAGINVTEEAAAEGMTGVGQYVTETIAKGDEISVNGMWDAFKRNSIAGGFGGFGMTSVGKVAAVPAIAYNNIQSKKINKAIKDSKEDYANANTLEEKSVIFEHINKLLAEREKVANAQKTFANDMSDEDRNNYMSDIVSFNILQDKYDKLEDKEGRAADLVKTQMQERLNSMQEIESKYKKVDSEQEVVQQDEAFIDTEQDMFAEDELAQLENEIAKAERIARDRQQPDRTPRPKQTPEPQQAKPVFALEMIGETLVNEQGVVGTIKEENGGVIWESEDGTQVIDGGGLENVDNVTISDMRLSFPETQITDPVQLTEGEAAPQAQPRMTQAKREELELMTEIELEDAIAKAEKDVADFETEVTQEAAKQAKVDRLVFPIGGKKFAVRQKPDGTFAVSQENDKGKFVGIKDGAARKQAIDEYNNLKEQKESDALSQAIELADEFKKEQDDKILNWLDNAISATSYKGRAFDATLGLPMFVANSSLKIVKAAYKAGKSLNEAIQDGIKYLKDNGYTVNELDFKKYVLEEGKKKPQAKPEPTTKPAPKPTTKPTTKAAPKANAKSTNPNASLKTAANNFKDGVTFSKQVREALKDFKGKFKESQVITIVNKAQKVKTQDDLDGFLDYAKKVFENANYVADVKKAKNLSTAVKKKFKKANKAVGNQQFKYAISINPEDLSNEDLARYNEFLTNVNSQSFIETNFIDEIDYFADKYEVKQTERKEKGEKAIASQNQAQDDLLASIKEAKEDDQSKVIRATDEVLDTILNLSEEDVRTLSKKDAYTLIVAMEYSLDERIHTAETHVVIRKFKSKKITDKLKETLGRVKVKKLMRDIFRPISEDTIQNYIEKNPFKNIGMIAKGIEETGLYKTLIQPIAVTYSSYLGGLRSYDEKLSRLYRKLKTKDDIQIHIVGLAKQKAMNPKAKELSSIEDIMDAIEVEVGRNRKFKEQGEEFIKAYKELLGNDKELNWEKAYDKLNKKAKDAFDLIEMHHTELQPKVAEAAARNGEGTIVYDYYSPINVLYTSASDIAKIGTESNDFLSGKGTIAKSVNLENRKENNAVLLLGARNASMQSTNSVLRNYYLREPLVTLNNALNNLIKDKEVKGQTLEFAKAIDASIKQTVSRLFENTHYEGSLLEKVDENLSVKGALRDLVSVSRAGIEIASNGIFAALYSPQNTTKGLMAIHSKSVNGQKVENIDLMDMAVKVGTTQFSRIFQGEGSPRQERENRVMRASNALEKVGNYILSKSDSVIAKPMWVGNFIGEFESISGKKLDIKALNSSAEYYAENKEAIDEARDIADDRLAQGFSSMNPFESVAYAQVSRNRKVVDVFDKYFIRFRIGEFASVAKAINNFVYGGEMSPREATALITATFARMSLYNYAILKSTALAGSFIAWVLGINMPDDDEEYLEKLPKEMGKGVLSSAITLLLFRRLGNLGSAGLTLGFEYMNMEKGFDLGLREKEEYDYFNDSYAFHQTISSLKLGQEYKGGEMFGFNVAASFAGPYNKYIKAIGAASINIKNGGIKNPLKEGEYILEPSYKEKDAIERANKKAIISGSDLVLTGLGIPFSRDIINIWGYINYEKSKNEKKSSSGSNRPARPVRPKLPRPVRPSN